MKVKIKILNYINMQLNFNSKIVLFFFFCYFLTSFTRCSAYNSSSYQRAHLRNTIGKVWVENADGLRSLAPGPPPPAPHIMAPVPAVSSCGRCEAILKSAFFFYEGPFLVYNI